MKKKLILSVMLFAFVFLLGCSKGDSGELQDSGSEEALKIERDYYDSIGRGIGELKIRSNFDNSLEIKGVVVKDILVENEKETCIQIHYSINNQYGNMIEDYFLWYANREMGVSDYKDMYDDNVKIAEGKMETDIYTNHVSNTHLSSEDDLHIFVVNIEDFENHDQ